MRSSRLLTLLVLMLTIVASAQAEFYVAGQLGIGFPNGFTNVRGTGTIDGAPFGNIGLANTLVYGAKVGYFFERWKWLGVEGEVFVSNPHVKQQSIVSGGGITTTTLENGAHLRVITPAVNLIIRRPEGRLQPYAGLGLAVSHTTLSPPSGSSSDTAPSLNVLIGLKGFLTDHLALFGEFKYNYAVFSFDNVGVAGAGVHGNYLIPSFVGGLAWHFR